MKIGILETGRPNPTLAARHGTYADMVAALLKDGDGLFFERFHVQEDEFPESALSCDGWVITGSRHSVTEETPWMLRLEELLRDAVDAKRPIFGICFGHQILAKALGADVRKAPNGWQLGLQSYQVTDRPDWMADAPDTLRINAIHEDQVLSLPEGARLLATSTACPFAGLAYGDVAASFQAHPEFTLPFEKDLLTTYSGVSFPDDLGQQALASVTAPDAETDSARIAQWVRHFFLERI